MKVLKVFDDKNYDVSWKKYCRESVRAIIVKDNKIALVKSIKEGYYKFPGGGIELAESHTDTLVRETHEETGLCVKRDSLKEYGQLIEKRKSLFSDEIFEQISYFYTAQLECQISSPNLDNCEIELGFMLEWAYIQSAYDTNMLLGQNYKTKFLYREAYIMGLLLGIRDKM